MGVLTDKGNLPFRRTLLDKLHIRLQDTINKYIGRPYLYKFIKINKNLQNIEAVVRFSFEHTLLDLEGTSSN